MGTVHTEIAKVTGVFSKNGRKTTFFNNISRMSIQFVAWEMIQRVINNL